MDQPVRLTIACPVCNDARDALALLLQKLYHRNKVELTAQLLSLGTSSVQQRLIGCSLSIECGFCGNQREVLTEEGKKLAHMALIAKHRCESICDETLELNNY